MYKLITIIACHLVFSINLSAQQENVYKVIANFANLHEPRQLTAFYLNSSPNGLVTALHGVLGADTITASIGFNRVYENMYISAIDIEHDIAIITCPALQKELVGNGLISGINDTTNLSDKTVIMYGTSYDTEAPEDIKMRIMEQPMWLLTEVIEPMFRSQLLARKSPSLNINVIRVQGDIAPGNSGAPVLYNNRVIGIASGGLRGGSTGRCWIIPIGSMNCTSFNKVKKTDAYKDLLASHFENPYLFNYQLATGEMTQAELNFCNSIDTLMAYASANFEGALGEVEAMRGIYWHYYSLYQMPNCVSTSINISADISGIRKGGFYVIYYNEDVPPGENKLYKSLINNYYLLSASVDKCLLNQGFEKEETQYEYCHVFYESYLSKPWTVNYDHITTYTNTQRRLTVYVRVYSVKHAYTDYSYKKFLGHYRDVKHTKFDWESYVDLQVFNSLVAE